MAQPNQSAESDKELRENISKVFKSFDADNSGFLDKPEIKKASKELGQELTDQELDQIFKEVAKSKPGFISLTEFTEWFVHGKMNKLVNLIKLRMAALNLLGKTEKVNKTIGKAIKKNKDSKPQEFEAKVKFGHDKPKSNLQIKLHFGKEAEEHFTKTKLDMELSSKLAFIFRFKVEGDVDAALKSLQETVDNLLTFVRIISEEEASKAIEMLQIKYTKDKKNIYIGFSTEDSFFAEPIEQFSAESLSQIPNDFEAKATLSAGIKHTFQSLKNDVPKEKIVLTALQGLQFEGVGKIDPQFMKHLRDSFMEDVDPSQLEWKDSLNFDILMSLINGGKGKLQFKDMGVEAATDFLKRIGSGESLDATPTTQELLDLARASQFQEYLTMAPTFVNDWINFLRAHVKANVSVMIKLPNFMGELKIKTKGVKEVFDYIFDRHD